MSVMHKRLQKELEIINKNVVDGIDTVPNDEDLRNWVANIKGPTETPYEGGTFKLSINFPERYPFEPPKIQFETPIIHPNISMNGKICISILRPSSDGVCGWSASMTIQKVLLSIVSLLSSPNPNDPLMPEIANLYVNDYDKFAKAAKKYTKKHAM